MKLEIEVPEVTCCRCSTTAPVLAPTALRRGVGPNSIVDSKGDSWITSGGSIIPQNWSIAPGAPTKFLCAKCTEDVNASIAALLKPVAPEGPVKTAATSIPTHAEAPVVGRVVKSSPTPTQAAARVTGGATIYANPVQRPEPVVSASPVMVQPSAISRPIMAKPPTVQPSMQTVLPPKIHAPIAPAERGSNVVVASNTQFPQPLVRNAAPVPTRADVPRTREVAVQDNEEVEPQGPVTPTALIRGVGV